MIRTLQKKFVITAMIAVSILLVVVLGALNVFNAVSNTRQLDSLLDELGKQGMSIPPDDGRAPSAPGAAPSDDNRSFSVPDNTPADSISASPALVFPEPGKPGSGRTRHRVFLDEAMDDNTRMAAIYFTVELDARCKPVRTDVSHIATVTEDEAMAYAQGLSVDRDSGSLNSFRYRIFPIPSGGYQVVFLDSSTRHTAVMRVILLSLLLGSVSWLLMLLLVIALSRRAILPIAENMERQRQFVTDAGHELKTPVAIIQANVDAMELRTGESKYSRNIRTQTHRLGELMNNLLTLARVDEYSVLEQPQQIDFSALCREVFTTFREPAELRQLGFSLDIEDSVTVMGDRNLLSQFCSILGDNAVKYCAESGEILVSVHCGNHRVMLRVSNTVSEVPDLSRLFDRFYRADTSRNQKSGGFGIGLSAAKTIAHLHHAELSADYDASRKLLTFSAQFPQ